MHSFCIDVSVPLTLTLRQATGYGNFTMSNMQWKRNYCKDNWIFLMFMGIIVRISHLDLIRALFPHFCFYFNLYCRDFYSSFSSFVSFVSDKTGEKNVIFCCWSLQKIKPNHSAFISISEIVIYISNRIDLKWIDQRWKRFFLTRGLLDVDDSFLNWFMHFTFLFNILSSSGMMEGFWWLQRIRSLRNLA